MALNISKFLKQFFSEAQEKLSHIQEIMQEFEDSPYLKESIVTIQREIHTIKGSSRMVGLKQISEVAHQLEEAFLSLYNDEVESSREIIALLYRGIDCMVELLQLARTKRELYDPGPLLKEIQKKFDQKKKIKKKAKDSTILEHVKKKYKVDFNSLKKKYKKKLPSLGRGKGTKEVDADQKISKEDKKTLKPATKEETASDGIESANLIKEDTDVIERKAKTIMDKTLPTEKAHLKIDNEQFETIINQITDLLSKRFFFNSVIQTCNELSQMNQGLLREWQSLKTIDNLKIKPQNFEILNNIDNIINLFFKKIQEFERSYKINFFNFESALRDVYDSLLDLKLTPLSTIFNIYPRFVRDFAYRTGKKIRIFIRGGDTQLDKTVIEKINEPLIHLIRNACDHGIESPEVREKKGKSNTGTIIIEAHRKGDSVEITISDDGRGLDKEIILNKAIEKDLLDAETASTMDEREIFDLIFQTGFSTAKEVSSTSGRGIGMDIVKKTLYQFGGSIDVFSRFNQETTFRLEFPISVFTNKVTYIKEEDITYAIPGNFIRKIAKLNAGEIQEKSNYSVVVYKGEIYTIAKLSQILTGETSPLGEKPAFLILPKLTEKKIGFVVDEILFESEAIIKTLGDFLGKQNFVYGMVIGEKGELNVVLDINDIINSDEFSKKIRVSAPPKTSKLKKKCILVVDDSFLVREMERNILENAGYEVITAVNGLDGYNKALTQRFDMVLADIDMPEMDGFEMIENIKKIEEYSDVPTLIFSSMENEEDKIKGISLGVTAWLQKQNFDDKEIIKIIKRFI
jgi:two-component system chemotaxis sensor kinase CheA